MLFVTKLESKQTYSMWKINILWRNHNQYRNIKTDFKNNIIFKILLIIIMYAKSEINIAIQKNFRRIIYVSLLIECGVAFWVFILCRGINNPGYNNEKRWFITHVKHSYIMVSVYHLKMTENTNPISGDITLSGIFYQDNNASTN